ncbi:MAG: hypothetical protein M3375_06135 [Actinomycetota bacterium]|nr:hypothetical protein [Actinomycetota bacterium]
MSFGKVSPENILGPPSGRLGCPRSESGSSISYVGTTVRRPHIGFDRAREVHLLYLLSISHRRRTG